MALVGKAVGDTQCAPWEAHQAHPRSKAEGIYCRDGIDAYLQEAKFSS